MDNFSLEVKVVVQNVCVEIFPYINVQHENGTIIISGYMGELWKIIEKALHFNNRYVEMTFKDGKEALINGSMDILLIPVVVTTSDADDFHFSIPVAKNWYQMYTKRKIGIATSASYLETWNTSLWIAFVSSIFTLSGVLWIMIRIRRTLGMEHSVKKDTCEYLPKWRKMMEENDHSRFIDHNNSTFSACFLMVLGGITSQGYKMNPKSPSLRIIMLVVLFFGLVMINSYAAVLVSRMAVDKVDILFPTLESVIDRKSHSLCVREISYAYRLFKENETDTEIIPQWRKIVNQPPCANVSGIKDIAQALCKDNTVILESPYIIASIAESSQCSVTRMPGRYSTSYTSLLMRKHFKYRKKIDQILQKLLTSGIIDYLQKKWLYRRMPPHSLNMSTDKPVTIHHVYGILVVYVLSILFSIVVLGIEKFTSWRKTKTMISLQFTH